LELQYAMTPFIAWFVTGSTKFAINSFKAGKLAFDDIGYGNFPSNHSAIVSSVATMIAIKEGIDHPAFSVSLALVFIVTLDASNLRRQVGKHAEILNRITNTPEGNNLRQAIGHTKIEIMGGIITGALTSFAIDMFM